MKNVIFSIVMLLAVACNAQTLLVPADTITATFVVSVNGIKADNKGNVTVPLDSAGIKRYRALISTFGGSLSITTLENSISPALSVSYTVPGEAVVTCVGCFTNNKTMPIVNEVTDDAWYADISVLSNNNFIISQRNHQGIPTDILKYGSSIEVIVYP